MVHTTGADERPRTNLDSGTRRKSLGGHLESMITATEGVHCGFTEPFHACGGAATKLVSSEWRRNS